MTGKDGSEQVASAMQELAEVEAAARTILRGVGVDPDRPVHPDGRAPWQQLLDQARALDRKPPCHLSKCGFPDKCGPSGLCYAIF